MAELMEQVLMQDSPCDLLLPEIIVQIFRLLDQKSLRQARLVCRKWNNCALEILSKIPGRLELAFDNENGNDGYRFERIKNLQCILRFTKYPEMFISNLYLHRGILVVDTQLFDFLLKFRPTLKSLVLECIALNLPLFRQMLENWCANLEELALYGINFTEYRNIGLYKTPGFATNFLRLKLRKFKVLDGADAPDVRNLTISIVNSSPKLKVLHVDIDHGQPDFWEKMQYLPHITNNLEEVKIERFGRGITDLGLVQNVSFSNKLTSFTLQIKDPSFPKEQLVTFLEKIGESLEKLFLHLEITILSEDERSDWKIELPLMKKLKVLEHSFDLELCFNSIDFLKNLPNVGILRLAWYIVNQGTISSKFVNDLFCNASYLPMHPHTTLNTLFLNGSPKNPETIFAINRIFPNLRDLTLVVKNSEIPDSSWWIRIFTGFTEMKNLKILHLIFNDSLSSNRGIDFETCFRHLEASESLEEIKISNLSVLVSDFDKSFPPSLEKVFVKIPKLKVLTINKFMMEMSESMKLFKALNQKGILLKTD